MPPSAASGAGPGARWRVILAGIGALILTVGLARFAYTPLLPVMHGVHVAAHVRGSELKLIPGLAHRFQAAFREPLLAAVLPYLRERRMEEVQLAQSAQPSSTRSPL